MNNVMVISPHIDDETLGAGGALLRHKAQGDNIFWCNITDMKAEYGFAEEQIAAKSAQVKAVIEAYGFNGFFNLGYRPAGLDANDIGRLVGDLTNIINEVKPNILYVPFYGDAHSDHRIVFDAIRPFLKSFRYPFIKRVLMMEIISETDQQFLAPFSPNVFVDITDFIEKKLQIMSIYKEEVSAHPFPRSADNIRALAVSRGAMVSKRHCEAFCLVKEVV